MFLKCREIPVVVMTRLTLKLYTVYFRRNRLFRSQKKHEELENIYPSNGVNNFELQQFQKLMGERDKVSWVV